MAESDSPYHVDRTTLATEGAYDKLFDGELPAGASCRLSIEFVSSGLPWRSPARRPLLGLGTFDGRAGRLEVIVLSVSANEARKSAERISV